MTNECEYKIQLLLPPGVESAAIVGDKFLRALAELSRVDPVFSNWTLWDATDKVSVPLEQVGEAMTAFVEKNAVSDEDDMPMPGQGFDLIASNFELSNPRSMTLSVTAGGRAYLNTATLQAGAYQIPPDASIVTYPIFKRALLILVSIWPCPWGRVLVTRPDGETMLNEIGGFSALQKRQRLMTWMGYLSAERADGLVAPPDVLSEPTPDGGLLMIATEEQLEPTNADQMRHCDRLAEIMDQRKGIPWL